MGVVVDYDETMACYMCGENDCDLYSCDTCGKLMCAECMPHMPDECPNEFCEDCV